MGEISVSVVLAGYNEEQNIVSTVEALRARCPELDLLVVNDGSSDATGALCREHGYPLAELPVNLGIGGSVQTGYRYALVHGYDAAVTLISAALSCLVIWELAASRFVP